MDLETIVVKIGGSVLTDKDEEFSLKEDVLERISGELASAKNRLVLVHGGGSYGHPVASEHDISSGFSNEDQLMGFSETHEAMEELNSKVVEFLLGAGMAAVPVQTSACTVVENGR